MRRCLLLLPLVILLLVGTALPGFAARNRYRAELTGKQEVPPVQTAAHGNLRLRVYLNQVAFELSLQGAMHLQGAHIHLGGRGENGPPIAELGGGPEGGGEIDGVLMQGTVMAESLLGELQGKTIADLVRLIQSGNTYVNIHTDSYPDGEIRGQIQ